MQSGFLLVLAVASVAFVASASAECENIEEWDCFKETFNKTYETPEEEEYRMGIYRSNLEKIEMLNSQNLTYRVGLTEYSDYTHEERSEVLNGYGFGNLTEPDEATPSSNQAKYEGETYPPVNWVEKGIVTPVKDQGNCGSCWAFSATGAMESAYIKKTGINVSLSEQQLVDCTGARNCSAGGLFQQAFQYVIDNKGINSEEQYPYEDANKTCRAQSTPAVTISDYLNVARGSEVALQKAVYEHGPVSVAIDANLFEFQQYTGGVFYNLNCTSWNLTHAVLVVGYDTDETTGLDYWIIKNSWDPKRWGMKGYGWIARNKDNHCGIATQASYPIV